MTELNNVVHQFGGDRVMRRPTARKSEVSSLFPDVLTAREDIVR